MTHTTRFSLIARLKDPADRDSWRTFVEIYSPFVYSLGRRSGLQDADACDLVQEVMREVAHSIQRFEPKASAGKFRGWLSLITRRTLSRLVKKNRRAPRGAGDTAQLQMLHEVPANEEADPWEAEHQQYVFQWAAQKVKGQVTPKTWEAFWATAIQGESSQMVAQRLGMSVGSVYIAKSRVQCRLRDVLSQVGDEA